MASRWQQTAIAAARGFGLLPLPVIWVLTRLPLVVLAVALGSQTDTTYLQYGQQMAAGAVPYRDFAVEYPPPSMLFLALPALAAHAVGRISSDSYTFFFGLQSLLLDALFCLGLARGAGKQAALWYLTLSLIAGSLLQTFDLLPAALTAAAVVLRQRGHDRYAWLALAVAIASKGWPLLLVPLFLALDVGRPRRLAANVGLAVLLFAVLMAPSLLGGITRAEESLAFHVERQPEVETIYANVAMAAHDVFGVAARVFVGGSAAVPLAHSSNVLSMLPGWGQLPHLMLALLLVLGYLRCLPRVRGNPAALPGSAALLVCLFILGFSVLQAQYILWLLPLAALVLPLAGNSPTGPEQQMNEQRLRIAASLVLFALLSHVLQVQWNALLTMQPAVVIVAIVRNACLVAALVFLWRGIPTATRGETTTTATVAPYGRRAAP